MDEDVGFRVNPKPRDYVLLGGGDGDAVAHGGDDEEYAEDIDEA